ncbi:monovalent cation/H+ antiporter subunit D [Aliagarivorans marinus]|uniref:monovalent cation/H+ antiporter subunit D n=1 Tax=Aliagarivorans marinus TaxID=561965 RepID=UPI0004193BA7|nr:monovalent cation/H+ antiporter subunit D [Aliagarivorans marinus]
MIKHLITLPILLPMLTGLLLLLPQLRHNVRYQRVTASLGNLASLIACVYLLIAVQDGIIAYALGDWKAPFGIVLYGDGLSALLVCLSCLLGFCVHLYACAGDDQRGPFFHPLFMFQIMGINGAFLTGDIFNLFVFFEILLIASYSLMVHGGGKAKIQANVHYVFLNLIGSALFLFALGTLYGATGTLNMADMAQRVALLDAEQQLIAKAGALLLLAVFGLKAAMVPVHFWLPKTYASATAPVAALFAIMTKVGLYSIWRVHGAIFGDYAGELANVAQPWLWPIGLATIALGVIAALASQSLRTLISNLVIVSVGTLLITIYIHQLDATRAGVYYLIHSTLSCAAMFLLAGVFVSLRGKAEDRLVSAKPMPRAGLLGSLFALLAIALIGMPPLSGFVGKALILQSIQQPELQLWAWSAILIGGLAALIGLSRAGTTLFWNTSGDHPEASTIHPLQITAILLLVISLPLMVVFGGVLTELSDTAAQHLHRALEVETLLEVSQW